MWLSATLKDPGEVCGTWCWEERPALYIGLSAMYVLLSPRCKSMVKPDGNPRAAQWG